MNVFVPYASFYKCARTLDDKRLIKQILECKQIISMNEKKRNDPTYKCPYLNHPVVKHYFDQENELAEYGLVMCQEYEFRFDKRHQYHLFFMDKLTEKKRDFRPIYVEGSANRVDSIRLTNDTNTIYRLFQAKLLEKWYSDYLNGHKIKWTRR